LVEVNPFDASESLPSVDVARALATRRVEEGYASAVRAAVTTMPLMVDVRRDADRIHATLQIPASSADRVSMTYAADRARAAIREHDPFVSCIDVSVVTYPDAVS
jgi:hypothetical protein